LFHVDRRTDWRTWGH